MADKESRLLTVEEMQKAIIDNPDVPMGVAIREAQLAKAIPIIQKAEREEYKDVLEVARAAILDACYCEDGLDASAGSAVMDWITDMLGDSAGYQPLIEGESNQTEVLKQKALDRQALKEASGE